VLVLQAQGLFVLVLSIVRPFYAHELLCRIRLYPLNLSDKLFVSSIVLFGITLVGESAVSFEYTLYISRLTTQPQQKQKYGVKLVCD
jgi:hypothetical protein